MWKKIVFVSLIVIAIAGIIYWLNYAKEMRMPVSDAINAIPSNAAIILESKQVKGTWKKLSETNIIWEELLTTETFSKLNSEARYIDSLIQSDPEIGKLLDNRSVFVSAHVSGANTFNFLYVYSLPSLNYQSTLNDFLKTINHHSEPAYRNYDGVDIGTIHPREKDSLSYAFSKGILIMSCKQNLVEAAIRQLKSGISLKTDKNFSKIINTSGKNVDANVYVNYKHFPDILRNFISGTIRRDVAALSDFADCSGWDITIKPNALMLSGFTQANDSSNNFLNLFAKQKSQEIQLTKVIPSNTALLLFFGISNIKVFRHDYKNYLNTKKYSQNYNQYIDDINKKYHINIESSMLEWMDSEMALVVTEPSSTNYINNSYAVIRSNNIEDAVNTLGNLADSINKKEKRKRDTVSYRGHIITHLNIPKILPHVLGWQFDKIANNYYAAIDNYVVFANSNEALRIFINSFENNKTLRNDKNYQAFSENISTEANIYLYSSIAHSTNIYSAFVNEQLAKDIENKLELFHKFEAVGIQFTANNKLFYSNVYLKYNPQYKQESTTIWETKLDTTVNSKPYLVINHNTKAKEIIVQDDANKIYLISNTGKILWTKQLNEKIMSDVIQIDVLKNNKLQMLFNTRSAIYLYDRNGNDLKGFPIKLKSSATNAISVFDYKKNRDYRIFIACSNKKILCYKSNGEEVIDFKFDKTNDIVYLPIQYFNIDNKDHICAVDQKGKIYILNRQGEMRVKMKESLAQGIRNFYMETGKDYRNTYLIAADTLGNVLKVNLAGDKERIKIQDFETSPYFDYRDINNDNTGEYIFVTTKQLKVFSKDKSLLFQYTFKENVSEAPLFFTFPDGKEKIGVVSESANELYLFNDNGSIYNGFPLTGKTGFSIGDLNNEGIYNLVTGSSDNSIYVYQLE